jgi:type I site-specific restriction-modification system R (restriction) subunit
LEFLAKISFLSLSAQKIGFMPNTRLPWFKTETREDKTFVFDPLRRRFVALTPEEEVRQKVLYLLVEHLGVPAGRLAVEYSVKVNGLDKRCDAVLFDAEGRPLMIVECKAPSVTLSQSTLEQAVRYHSALHPRFLLLSNGAMLFCYKVEGAALQAMDHLPDYAEMQASASA